MQDSVGDCSRIISVFSGSNYPDIQTWKPCFSGDLHRLSLRNHTCRRRIDADMRLQELGNLVLEGERLALK